jgi:ElaB/YqjD/DUF883 family membrane-anchored ribosome-binding protein
MPQSTLGKASEHIADSVREASRVTAAVADAFEDGVGVARRAAKQSSDAAKDFVNDSTRRIQRNPLATVAASLAAGFAVGILTGLAIRRRCISEPAETSPAARHISVARERLSSGYRIKNRTTEHFARRATREHSLSGANRRIDLVTCGEQTCKINEGQKVRELKIANSSKSNQPKILLVDDNEELRKSNGVRAGSQ